MENLPRVNMRRTGQELWSILDHKVWPEYSMNVIHQPLHDLKRAVVKPYQTGLVEQTCDIEFSESLNYCGNDL